LREAARTGERDQLSQTHDEGSHQDAECESRHQAIEPAHDRVYIAKPHLEQLSLLSLLDEAVPAARQPGEKIAPLRTLAKHLPASSRALTSSSLMPLMRSSTSIRLVV
jgi:hypothetical protein